MCVKTWNVTRHLEYSWKDGKVVHVALPNGVSKETERNVSTEFAWLFPGDPLSHDAAPIDLFKDMDWGNRSGRPSPSIMNLFVIYESVESPLVAIEVFFHLCVNRYNVSVSQNVLSRALDSSSTKTTFGPVLVPPYPGQLLNATSIVSPDDKEEKFPFGGLRFWLMKLSLDGWLSSNYDNSGNEIGTASARLAWMISDAFYRKETGQAISDPVMEAVTNLTRNIAMSISQR